MIKYKWKTHGLGGVSAQIVGDEISRLEKEANGALLPATVVQAARPMKSPLHPCFEWDNSKAAKAYREQQAREILRKIVVVYENDKGEQEEIRAFVSIRDDNDEAGYYTSTARLVDDDELLGNVLEQILSELIAIKNKYAQFRDSRLQKIWAAVDEAVESEP
jgi:hypothetical protein